MFHCSYIITILQEDVINVLINGAGLMFILNINNYAGQLFSLLFTD